MDLHPCSSSPLHSGAWQGYRGAGCRGTGGRGTGEQGCRWQARVQVYRGAMMNRGAGGVKMNRGAGGVKMNRGAGEQAVKPARVFTGHEVVPPFPGRPKGRTAPLHP